MFGLLAYIFVPKDLRKNLESHTRKVRFIGYLQQMKGWMFMDPLTCKIYATNAAHFDKRVCPGLRRTNDPIPDLRELFLLADDLPDADLPEQVGVEVGDVLPDPPAPVPPVALQPPIVAAPPQVDDHPAPEARPDQPPHQPQGRGQSRTPAGPPVPYVMPDRRYPEHVRNPPGEWWKVKSPAPAPAPAPVPAKIWFKILVVTSASLIQIPGSGKTPLVSTWVVVV